MSPFIQGGKLRCPLIRKSWTWSNPRKMGLSASGPAQPKSTMITAFGKVGSPCRMKLKLLISISPNHHRYSFCFIFFVSLYITRISYPAVIPSMNFFNLKTKTRAPPDIVRGLRDAAHRLESGAPGDTRRKVCLEVLYRSAQSH